MRTRRSPVTGADANGGDGSSPFWVAYADLMAGIFLVFLLMLVTALYHHAQAQARIREDMAKNLAEQKKKLARIQRMSREIAKLKVAVAGGKDAIARFLAEQRLKTERIDRLEDQVLHLKRTRSDLDDRLADAKEQIESRDSQLGEKSRRIEDLDDRILKIQEAFRSQLEVIEDQARKIRTLFGVRRDIVERLRGQLAERGDLEVRIDPVSGAIQLGGGILFEEASAEIRPQARQKLETFVQSYLRVLLESAGIRKHLAQIVIEGHTNDNGPYLRNLRLSQERSRAVMEYLLSLQTPYLSLLETYVVASGRSFSVPILTKDGRVDKVRSRRIEFKFRLKDEEAVRSLGEVLDRQGRPEAGASDDGESDGNDAEAGAGDREEEAPG